MTKPSSAALDQAGPPVGLRGLLDLRPILAAERTGVSDEEAAEMQALAIAKVYAFASADYPGAAQSQIWDNNGVPYGFGNSSGTFSNADLPGARMRLK